MRKIRPLLLLLVAVLLADGVFAQVCPAFSKRNKEPEEFVVRTISEASLRAKSIPVVLPLLPARLRRIISW